MEMNEYQVAAMRTSVQHPHWGDKLDNAILGLSGEIGEVADSWKKHKYHGHAFDPTKMMEELGDLLWYIAQAADAIGYPLNIVARNNLEKLEKRYPDGFSSKRSINR
jgi:NTP pyrophosphatase (non-canonical NTP hydrolase)